MVFEMVGCWRGIFQAVRLGFFEFSDDSATFGWDSFGLFDAVLVISSYWGFLRTFKDLFEIFLGLLMLFEMVGCWRGIFQAVRLGFFEFGLTLFEDFATFGWDCLKLFKAVSVALRCFRLLLRILMTVLRLFRDSLRLFSFFFWIAAFLFQLSEDSRGSFNICCYSLNTLKTPAGNQHFLSFIWIVWNLSTFSSIRNCSRDSLIRRKPENKFNISDWVNIPFQHLVSALEWS